MIILKSIRNFSRLNLPVHRKDYSECWTLRTWDTLFWSQNIYGLPLPLGFVGQSLGRHMAFLKACYLANLNLHGEEMQDCVGISHALQEWRESLIQVLPLQVALNCLECGAIEWTVREFRHWSYAAFLILLVLF
jgi:hypothetical protein